jgi:predicted dehydrogenase
VERGLDVYCEKPLSYDVREGQAMAEAARKTGRIVQVGFQRRQSDAVRQASEFIESGKAGTIVQVDAQIHYTAEPGDTTVQDPPVSLDWEAWCGPAPLLPYRPSIGHFAWRLEAAYGNGHLVDWGIHWIDAVRTVLGLGMPRYIQASGGIYRLRDSITTPDTLTVHFEYERCPLVWRHRLWGAAEFSLDSVNGMFFFGEKATVFVTDNHWEVIPTGKEGRRERYEAKPDRSFTARHMADFLDAVRNRRQPACPVDDAFQSTAAVQLAMIAYRTANRVEWDAAAESVRGNPPAAALLRREYRLPWRHPAA